MSALSFEARRGNAMSFIISLSNTEVGIDYGTERSDIIARVINAGISFARDFGGFYHPRQCWTTFLESLDRDIVDKHFLVLLDKDDAQGYSEFFDELSLDQTFIITITQVFSLDNRYLGAWLSLVDSRADASWLWIDPEWNHLVCQSLSAVLEQINQDFRFTSYAALNRRKQEYFRISAGTYRMNKKVISNA